MALTADIGMYIQMNWLADAQITDSQMCTIVNTSFHIQLRRRIVPFWRHVLQILYRQPLRLQFQTEQQKDYSYHRALDLPAMTDAAQATDHSILRLEPLLSGERSAMGEVWARAMEPNGAETDDEVPERIDGMGRNRPGLQIPVDSVLHQSWVVAVSEDPRGIECRGAMLCGHRLWLFRQDGLHHIELD
jgi:hypothetical protein